MRELTLRLLGPFAVLIDGVPATGFSYAKVRALLAYLALQRRHPHSRAALATLLWPDQPERVARASLSQALTTLRTALGDKDAAQPILLADSLHVQLDPSCQIAVDVAQFQAALQNTDMHAHYSWRTCSHCAEHLQAALALYSGPFLADVLIPDSDIFEEWVTRQREHIQQRVLSALAHLIERLEWCGDYAAALPYARQLVALEPLLETSQRTLLRLLALNDEPAAALAQFRQFSAMLASELDAEPEAATNTLISQIRRGTTTDLAPARPPFLVPEPPTALINRSSELAAICAQLRDPAVRAVTVTGTGGIGKTRFALAAAHALRHDFADGVFFVELAPLGDAALVADAIAQALGVKEQANQPISAVLRGWLRAKQLLLVLDNFEHVVAAAPLVADLLAASPALTVLATSRVPLNIRAEQPLALQPLAEADAVQLFIDRARAAGATLPEEAADFALYAAICRRVDCLPLAIELIAVRARTLSPHDLLGQLECPLQALVRGPRDIPARHQALRSAIQWSYDLLDAAEQRVFRHMGVFAGGWSVAAAQAVVGMQENVLPLLESLHAASLLQCHAVAGETRFALLETIREFAREQLTRSDAAGAASARHMAHYTAFAVEAEIELLRADAPRWRVRVAAEQDNLRAAFRWAIEQEEYTGALRLAAGVWRFHWMSGLLREGLERLETALAHREHTPPDVQANAMRGAGSLAGGLSDFARARRWLEEGVDIARRLGDARVLQGSLTGYGYTLYEQGDLATARVQLEEGLALTRQIGDRRLMKFPVGILAGVHQRLGNLAIASELAEECLHINREYNDPEGTANALRTLATIIFEQGLPERARQLCEEALAMHGTLKHQLGLGLDYVLLGDISRDQGDLTGALAHYRHCLSLWRERENRTNSALVFARIAQILAWQGGAETGAALLAAAAEIHKQNGALLWHSEQERLAETARVCRASLGESKFAAASAAGRALLIGQVLELALQPTPTADQRKFVARTLKRARRMPKWPARHSPGSAAPRTVA